jgi:hypothetical protein
VGIEFAVHLISPADSVALVSSSPLKMQARRQGFVGLDVARLAILACFSIAGWNSTTGRPRTVIGCAQGDYIHAVSR